jgi:hypothetical protein
MNAVIREFKFSVDIIVVLRHEISCMNHTKKHYGL